MDDGATWPWEESLPEDVDWRAPVPTRVLPEIFEETIVTYANRPAIDFLDRIYSFGELGDLVHRATAGLQAMGVEKGSRVGLMLPNCPAYVVFYWATLAAGGTVVNVSPLYAPEELATQIEDSETDILITLDLKLLFEKAEPMLARTRLKTLIVAPLADQLPGLKSLLFRLAKRREIAKLPARPEVVHWRSVLSNGGRFTAPPLETDDVAVLQYTGGTTGLPKAAMLTHANLSANMEQGTLLFPQTRPGEEVMLGVLPLFHVFAMTVVMTFAIRNGAKMILLPRFELDQMLKTIDKKKPTFFPAVPTIYIAVNNHAGVKSGKFDLSSIDVCLSGGAALPLDVKETFEKLTGCTLVEGYGLSETSPIAACNPSTGESRPGSLGLPAPQTIFEITDIEDPLKVLPQGEKGEICISGPQVMKGYWKREAETDTALAGGRFHSGDVGYIDEDGYIFLIDRLKEVILAGGYSVYPRYVEEAIYKHPAVEEVTVIGVDDAYRQQSVKAFIRTRNGESLTTEALLDFLKDKLSPVELPKEIEFRDELPKTAVGKLSKKELIAEEAAKRAAP